MNLAKSKAYASSGVPSSKKIKFTNISGISFTTNLDKYLGFPMMKGKAKKEDYNFLLDRIQSKLASWKLKLLNRAGRQTLANDVICSIPSYSMQISWLPQNVCNSIDCTVRDFIWKGSASSGLPMVSWKKIARPKQVGGLGVCSARMCNTALLGKLVWDLCNCPSKLWVQILSHKYVSTEGF